MVEPIRVDRYICPVPECGYEGKGYEKAKVHVNIPVIQLPIGLIYSSKDPKTPNFDEYRLIAISKMQRDHIAFHITVALTQGFSEINFLRNDRASEILKRMVAEEYSILDEETFKELIARSHVQEIGRNYGLEGFIRDSPEIQNLIERFKRR